MSHRVWDRKADRHLLLTVVSQSKGLVLDPFLQSMTGDTINQDHRKRSMEALERRFAVAKAELLQHHKKHKKGENGEAENKARCINGSSNNSSKKDVEEADPVYSRLSTAIHENLLTSDGKLSGGRGSMVGRIAHELLQNGDAAQKYMLGSKAKKIDNWILLDNFVQNSGHLSGFRNNALQQHSKRSRRRMSMKKLKDKGLFDLPQQFHKFNIFLPMHEMWKSYMLQLLKAKGKNQLSQCILSADLHGAFISVAECKSTSLIGVNGIMIRETAETFGIMTRRDKFRVVPKKLSVFVFGVDGWKITLQGGKLASRNLDIL